MLSKEHLTMIATEPRMFLNQCYKMQERVRIKEHRIGQLEQLATHITSTIKPVATYSGPGDKIADCAIAIADLKAEINEEIRQLTDMEKTVAEGIQTCVPDLVPRSILEARYLAGMRWEEIAYEYHFAYRWVLRLHKKALAEMKEKAEEMLNAETQQNI